SRKGRLSQKEGEIADQGHANNLFSTMGCSFHALLLVCDLHYQRTRIDETSLMQPQLKVLRRPWVIVAGVCALLLVTLAGVSSPRRIQRLGFWLSRSRDRGAVVFLGDSIVSKWRALGAAFPGW